MKFSSSVILVSRSLGLTSTCLKVIDDKPLGLLRLSLNSDVANDSFLDLGVLATVLKVSFLALIVYPCLAVCILRLLRAWVNLLLLRLLGEFESTIVASWSSTVPAVIVWENTASLFTYNRKITQITAYFCLENYPFTNFV